jgi:hypothetical protein
MSLLCKLKKHGLIHESVIDLNDADGAMTVRFLALPNSGPSDSSRTSEFKSSNCVLRSSLVLGSLVLSYISSPGEMQYEQLG